MRIRLKVPYDPYVARSIHPKWFPRFPGAGNSAVLVIAPKKQDVMTIITKLLLFTLVILPEINQYWQVCFAILDKKVFSS